MIQLQLHDISLLSILLPGGMVFLSWKKHLTPLRIISVFILFTLVLEFVAKYYHWQGKNNLFLFHLFTTGETIFLFLYFRATYEKIQVKRILETVLLLFLALSVWNIVNREPLNVYPSTQRYTECILMMVLSIYFFVELFQKSQVTNLIHYPHYWLVSGFLLYFAGTFFLNIVGEIAITTDKLGFSAYDIHSVLNIFLNVIYTTVLWMSKRASISGR